MDQNTETVNIKTTGEEVAVEMPEFRVDTVRPLIESFLKRMTQEQWRLLKLGTSDDAIKVMLADLLLDLITAVSKALFMALSGMELMVSEESVVTSLGNKLPQCFAEVLGIREEVVSDSSKHLTHLIVKEVTESVNSAIFSSVCSGEPAINQRITSPHIINAMVSHACKMLKSFSAKIKLFCSSRPSTRQGSSPDSSIQTASLGEIRLEFMELEDDGEEREDKASLEDNIVTATTKAVQDIISKEVGEILEPLLDGVSESNHELLLSETSREIEFVADDIAQILVVKSVEEKDTADSRSNSNQRCTQPLKGVGCKIRSLFAKRFAKASLQRIVAQLKNNFHLESNVECRSSMQSLIESVDSLLLKGDSDKQAGNEVCLFQRFKNISSDNVLSFTQELSALLYDHITDGLGPDITPGPFMISQTCSTGSAPPTKANMHFDIRNKVWCFLGLMGWWVNTQVGGHSKRVTLAVMDAEPKVPTQSEVLTIVQVSEPLTTAHVEETNAEKAKLTFDAECASVCEETRAKPVQERNAEEDIITPVAVCASACEEKRAQPVRDSTPQEKEQEKIKMSVRILVEKLVTRTLDKAGVSRTIGKPENTIKRLFQSIWAEVEGTAFQVTPEMFQTLDKVIFKDLCKKWGCAEMVVVSMNLGEPAMEKCIASLFSYHLMAPPIRRFSLSRIFSHVCRVVSRPFTLP